MVNRISDEEISAHGRDASSHGPRTPPTKRDPATPLSNKSVPGSWIARMSHSWKHGDDSTLRNVGVVRGVEPDQDPTVDWVKVLRELQVEKKRANAKKNQKYINRSCYLFESNTPLRESVINLVEWHWFDRIVLFLILANCCFLVLDDPVCRCTNDLDCSQHEAYVRLLYSGWDCSSWPDILRMLDISEVIFTVLFTLEMLIKIVARGFILHKHAFLRDGWNWIDFVVVVASLVSRLPSLSANLQMLRTVRVLRPLRTMTRIKGMRPLVNTFLRSFKSLGNVILLLFFCFCVFGILGIELLTGALRGRCFVNPNQQMPGAVRTMLESQQVPYIALPNNNVGGWNANVGLCGIGSSGVQCDAYAIDGVEYETLCSNKKWCFDDWCSRDWMENPFDFGYGLYSFDNIGASWLVIFQILTVEGWTDILYMYEDGFQRWGARLFHTAWVLIGTFFVVQLALAVLANSFVMALEEEKIHKAREAMDEDSLLRPTRAMARRFTMFKTKRSSSFARVESASSGMQQGFFRQNFFSSFQTSFIDGGRSMMESTVQKARQTGLSLWCEYNIWGPGTAGRAAYEALRRWCRMLVRSDGFSKAIILAIVLNTLCLALDYHDQVRYETDICIRRCELDPDIPAAMSDRCMGPLFNRTFVSDGRGGGMRPEQTGNSFCFVEDQEQPVKGDVQCAPLGDEAACYAGGGGGVCWWFKGDAVPCKRGLYNSSSFVQLGDRTLSLRHLCGDQLDQCSTYPPERQEVFERINAVLTFLFISEMVLKMIGLGFLEYFEDQFNQFDFFVVMASIIELTFSSSSSGSTISALRGMRLFRLFKLARSWKSMRKILKTLGIALGSLGPLTVIWVMFMYIFALLGMQYFGGTFRAIKTDSPRSNFDSFFPSQLGHGAFLVTFQIITSENWNSIAYSSIGTANSAIGAMPSILVVLFGNYIIMNLFISILLQGFAEDGFDEEEEASHHAGRRASAADAFRKFLGRAGTARTTPLENAALQRSMRRLSDGLAGLASTTPGAAPADARYTLQREESAGAMARAGAVLRSASESAGDGAASAETHKDDGGEIKAERQLQKSVMMAGSVHSVKDRDQAGVTPLPQDAQRRAQAVTEPADAPPSGTGAADAAPLAPSPVRGFSTPNTTENSPIPSPGAERRVLQANPEAKPAEELAAAARELTALDFDSTGAGGRVGSGQDLVSHTAPEVAPTEEEGGSALAKRSVQFSGMQDASRASPLAGQEAPGLIFATGFMRDVHEQEEMEEVEVTFLNLTFMVPNHPSFWLLSPTNPLRLAVGRVVHSSAFDHFILLCILITSITLIIEAPDDTIVADACPKGTLDCSGLALGQTEQVNCPREQDPDFGRVWAPCGESGEAPCCAVARKMEVLQTMDAVFTIIFTVEMAMKLIVEGLLLHRKAYFRNGWNLLDAAIVVISWITTFTSSLGGVSASIKALRAVRALRPLRVIQRNPGLRIAVVCLLSSLPAMINVAVVVVLWFSMYAMLGVQFFKGELYRCYDLENQVFYGAPYDALGNFFTQEQRLSGAASVPTIVECVGRTGGLGSWEDRDYSFNSYPQALLTLFEMATTEGWMSVMAAVVDGVSPGVSPIPNHKPWYSIFCVVHLIIGAFVLLNLIVGSIINNYNRIKNYGDNHSPYLTREQQEWIDTQKLVNHLKPKSRKVGPKHPFRALMYKIVIHPWFDIGVTCCIVGNMLAMMTRTHNNPACYGAVMFYINLFFTTVFVLETCIKLTGLGPRWYFMDGWNRFDITVTVLSVCMTAIDISNEEFSCDSSSDTDSIPSLQILRTFRIARVFRLIRHAQGLKQMIQTLIISLPALGNIGALILLFITIFAVLGTTAFYNVNLEQDLYGYVDGNGNYRTFDNAFWILFRQTTGEAWNGIMYYCFQTDAYKACDKRYGEYLGSGCGGPFTGIAFHLLWQLFGTYVLMQLFTAVILENFDDLAKEDVGVVPMDKLHHFVDVWTEFDPSAREKIPSDRLPALISSLAPPLGVKSTLNGYSASPTRTDLMLVIKDLPIPIYNGHIHYKDTFLGCVKRVIALELSHKVGAEEPSTNPDRVGSFDSHRNTEFDTSIPRRTSSQGTGQMLSRGSSQSGARSPAPVFGSTPKFRGRAPTVAEDYAARTVQLAFREYKENRLQVCKALQRTKYIPLCPTDEAVITW